MRKMFSEDTKYEIKRFVRGIYVELSDCLGLVWFLCKSLWTDPWSEKLPIALSLITLVISILTFCSVFKLW